MATRYHQQSYAHTRPPTRRPLGPGEARANMHPGSGPSQPAPSKPAPPAPHAQHAQHAPRRPPPPSNSSPSHRNVPHGDSADRHARASPSANRGNNRVSVIKSQEHRSKRDSEISNASSTGSGSGGRKRTIGQWQLGRTVGKGGCSTVRLVRHVVTGQQGAVKIISRKTAEQVRAQSLANLAASQERSLQDLVAAGKMMPPPPPGLMREIAIMKLLNHPNIVKLFDVWENHNELYLVMEYVPGGELFHYVEENRGLDEKESVYIFRQIIAALLYCHRLHIHHRDLKPENILLDRDAAQIKLVDFGMAALQPEGKQLTTACGSPHYAAPEVIRSKPYDGAKADVWSCGVILYVMLTGMTPFNYDGERNLHKMYADIQAAEYYMPPELTYHAKDLLRKIFQTRPEKRISMDEIWDHPLMHKYDKDYGYEGDLTKKDKWIGPAAELDQALVKHEGEIDGEILRNMRTLWHSVPQHVLVKKLLSKEPNQEKLFYAALDKHKREHTEDYAGGDDGLSYAASDYQHHKAESAESPLPPNTKQTSQSSYSILNNEHLRSSSVAEAVPSMPPSEDLQRHVRSSTATRNPHMPRGASHKRGNSATSALRVEMLKKANQGARQARDRTTQRVSPAPGMRSRSASRTSVSRNSRQSLTSSVWPSSPPVIHPKKAPVGHKRNVSFQHIRKTSAANANSAQPDPASSRHAPTPDVDEDLPAGMIEVDEDEEDVDDDGTGTDMSSPTRRVSNDANVRKAKVPQSSNPRSKTRKPVNSGAFIRTEVRKVSSELEKACEEAFNNSSFNSINPTASSFGEVNSPYDTPPSSISNHATGAPILSPSGRPLPAVPMDTPNTFIAKTLEETRRTLALRYTKGEVDASKINEILASIERLIPAAEAEERRTTSAPEPKSAADLGFLPIITEEPLPDTLRVGKGADTSHGPRSFTAPGPSYQTGPRAQGQKAAGQDKDTIRIIQQSPAGPAPRSNLPSQVSQRPRSRGGQENNATRPKTSDGPPAQDDNLLQVPDHRDALLRKKSYDSAIGFKQEEVQQSMAQESSAKKESFWFRRWKKDPQAGMSDSNSKTKPSMLKRDKQPPAIALPPHNANIPSGPPTDSSDFPMRRVSEGEKQGFSKWLGKLQKKDEPLRAIEIKGMASRHSFAITDEEADWHDIHSDDEEEERAEIGHWCFPRPSIILPKLNASKLNLPTLTLSLDPQPSPGISSVTSSQQGQFPPTINAAAGTSGATTPISPTGGNNSPTAPVVAQSWFARFFRLQPSVRVTAFSVPRSRARAEVYRLLRDFQHHGLADLTYFPQENAITGRVEKSNALGIRPVAFRVEFFVVLSHGKRSGLSLSRWTQTRGAAASFESVVGAVEKILGDKGMLVQEEARRRELVGILG